MTLTDLHYFLSSPAPVTQRITLTAAVAGAVAPGPMVRLADDPAAPAVSAKVFRHPDYRHPVAGLTALTTWGISDRVNEAGTGSIEVPNSTDDATAVDLDDLVRISIHGRAAFTVSVDEIASKTVLSQEEVGYRTTFSGTGHLGLLHEAVVMPARGAGTKPVQEDRRFNWASLDLNDSGWATATVIAIQSADISINPQWADTPSGWADPSAGWIWARSGTVSAAAVGWCYTRKRFTVPPGVSHLAIDATADNGGEVYLDGDLIITMDNFTGIFSALIEVTEGEHLLAISGTNPLDTIAPANPAGILAAAWSATADGTRGDLLVHTDVTWLIVEYPDHPPGMNVGEVVTILLAEAQADGLLPGWTLSFDADVDTDGQPWADYGDIATKVGTDYRTFFLDELCQTYCDMNAQPGGLVLDAYAHDGLGSASTVELHTPTDPTDPRTGNILDLTHTRRSVTASEFLTRWTGGWDLVDIDPLTRPKRTTLGLGAQQSLPEVDRLATEQLTRYANIRTAITCRMRPQTEAETPYVGLGKGDTLTVPDLDRTPVVQRLLGIGVAPDGNGLPEYTLEIADIFATATERNAVTLRKYDVGTVRGDARIATPVSQISGTTTRNCCVHPPDEGGGG